MEFWIMRLRNTDGLRERFHQIKRAKEHYDADQFDSCALQLIAVMDGFVNDFEPKVRKGLTSRDPDDMTAWDSVVGHHMGLTHALKSFTKTIKKRVDDEVFELHRNGIMHGSVVRFDNVVVATKAWNMLFAVVDWATATIKSQRPVEPKPSWRELAKQIRDNRKVKEQLNTWESATLAAGDPGLGDHEIYRLTAGFLNSWRETNYGALADYCSRRMAGVKRKGQHAGEMRELFDGFTLTDFDVAEVENSAPAIWLSRGTATVNGESGTFECRWLIEDDDGNLGYGDESANWRLVFCSPSVWRRDE